MALCRIACSMLKSLKLRNVGPAPELEMELSGRMNLITGDNGLGKSFLLDVAWWVLTRRWPHDLNDRLTTGYPARPSDPKAKASISFELTTARNKPVRYESIFSAQDQSWIGRPGRPWNPGLVIYAHADGGFSVWDPARNYWKKQGNVDVQDRIPGFVFSAKDVWDGLTLQVGDKSTRVSNGLLLDWAAWIRERGDTAQRMEGVLRRLAPEGEGFEVGPLVRLSVDDARDIPSIRMPYHPAVPVLHAASGVRRALGLAYMLLWSWNEHVRASELLGQSPTDSVVLLFDELESHLHPRWQRTMLGAVLHVVEELHKDAKIQLIAATHSPLILASAESLFDPDQDAWFDLDLEHHAVVLRRRPFVALGEVSRWLTSDAFDLKQARSREAERAIEGANAVLRDQTPTRRALEEAHQELLKARLPDIDPFWVRWGHFVEKHTSKPDPEGDAPRKGRRR
jgi:hypothetical protein